jgi:hypothetical protein
MGSQVVLSGFNGLGEPYKSFVTFFRHLVPAIDTDTVSAARYCQLWNLCPCLCTIEMIVYFVL